MVKDTKAMRMPGFSAMASIYASEAIYRAGAGFTGAGPRSQATVEPAARRATGCFCGTAMKGPYCCCSFDFGSSGVTSCCNAQGCDTFRT